VRPFGEFLLPHHPHEGMDTVQLVQPGLHRRRNPLAHAGPDRSVDLVALPAGRHPQAAVVFAELIDLPLDHAADRFGQIAPEVRDRLPKRPAALFLRQHLPVAKVAQEGGHEQRAALLRHLRDRQVLTQEQGRWTLGQSVPDLRRDLPESVRGMIQRKIGQLGEDDRRLLVAASVQGYEFDSAVVARVLGRDAAEVEERLDELDRVHAFVRAVREHEFPDRTLTLRYRFVHVLYQNALYASLGPTRRASLSAAVAQALLAYYKEKSGSVAAELALLLEAARDFSRAADYFLVAARNAVRVFANQEAVVLARRGVELLVSLPDTPERARKELDLQITLGPALFATKDWTAPDAQAAYMRAHVLCRELGESPDLFPALWGLCFFRIARGNPDRAESGRAAAWPGPGRAGSGSPSAGALRAGTGPCLPRRLGERKDAPGACDRLL
jgi:hypothetical protein